MGFGLAILIYATSFAASESCETAMGASQDHRTKSVLDQVLALSERELPEIPISIDELDEPLMEGIEVEIVRRILREAKTGSRLWRFTGTRVERFAIAVFSGGLVLQVLEFLRFREQMSDLRENDNLLSSSSDLSGEEYYAAFQRRLELLDSYLSGDLTPTMSTAGISIFLLGWTIHGLVSLTQFKRRERSVQFDVQVLALQKLIRQIPSQPEVSPKREVLLYILAVLHERTQTPSVRNEITQTYESYGGFSTPDQATADRLRRLERKPQEVGDEYFEALGLIDRRGRPLRIPPFLLEKAG